MACRAEEEAGGAHYEGPQDQRCGALGPDGAAPLHHEEVYNNKFVAEKCSYMAAMRH